MYYYKFFKVVYKKKTAYKDTIFLLVKTYNIYY
jgi:hypothetical protein